MPIAPGMNFADHDRPRPKLNIAPLIDVVFLLLVFFIVTAMLLFFAAAGIYHFERDAQPELFSSVFSSLWCFVVMRATFY